MSLKQDAPAAAVEPAPDFYVEDHLFFWFTQVLSRRNRQLAIAFQPYGLRIPEFRVLGVIHSRKHLPMQEVADLAGVEPTTLSRTVDRMEHAGWVLRVSDAADARVTRLSLTADGTQVFMNVLPLVKRLNEAVCARLPAPVVPLLRWALEQMRDALDENLLADEGAAARLPARNSEGRTR